MNISEANRPIAIKFYLKHHWGGGKAAWGFGADQFITLVSMATVIAPTGRLENISIEERKCTVCENNGI